MEDMELAGRIDAYDVLFTAGFLIVVTLIAVATFKAMDRPRLRLTMTDGALGATRRDWILYLVATPGLIICWWIYFSVLILLSPAQTAFSTLVVMPLSAVVAIRILAHFNLDASYHLSSVVPLVIIASILIGEGLPDADQLRELAEQAEASGWITVPALIVVLAIDYFATTIWYLTKTRLRNNPGPWPRGYRVESGSRMGSGTSPSGSSSPTPDSGLAD